VEKMQQPNRTVKALRFAASLPLFWVTASLAILSGMTTAAAVLCTKASSKIAG
jgi:hypothetical protein